MRVLEIGCVGADVANWQEFLIMRQLDPGGIDGSFGPLTKTATENFQRNADLAVDGIVGNKEGNSCGELKKRDKDADPITLEASRFDRLLKTHFLFRLPCNQLLKRILNRFQFSGIWLQAHFEIIEDRFVVGVRCGDLPR